MLFILQRTRNGGKRSETIQNEVIVRHGSALGNASTSINFDLFDLSLDLVSGPQRNI